MRAERVLVVTDEMEVGGSQRQIVHLLRGLRQQGRAAELLYFRKPSHLLEHLQAAGVPVHRIKKSGAIDPIFIWRLAGFLRRGRYDVVHAFSITAELWVRLLLPITRGLRLVSSIRGLSLIGPAWHWRAKRWILGGSSAVISNSQAGASLVAERCDVPQKAIDVVPNGLELPPSPSAVRRQVARRELAVPGDQVLMLFVGRLVPEKNLPFALEALMQIPEFRRPWLWLAGDGPERARITLDIERLGLTTNVRLLGERSDTLSLMQAADFLVLPSSEEGLSNVILEAMGSALPVIATAVGGSPELIEDAVNGRLLPSGDVGALSEAIEQLTSDVAERARLGRAARDHAEAHFAVSAMVERTAAVYDRCMDRSGAMA